MKHYILYADGACLGNPGIGGWGLVLQVPSGNRMEQRGGELHTTNNRMELQAMIEGLNRTPEEAVVEAYTDSQYVQKGITLWLKGWKQKGWKTSGGDPVKNQDLWEVLDGLVGSRKVTFHWVRGHAGNLLNERADELARYAALEVKMRQAMGG